MWGCGRLVRGPFWGWFFVEAPTTELSLSISSRIVITDNAPAVVARYTIISPFSLVPLGCELSLLLLFLVKIGFLKRSVILVVA